MQDKTLLLSQITLVQKEAREKGNKKRPRCPYCGSRTYVVRIDKNRLRKKDKKVGRPRKRKTTRYTKTGHYCYSCKIHFYNSGTPNFKLHPRTIELPDIPLLLIYVEGQRPRCQCGSIVYVQRIDKNRDRTGEKKGAKRYIVTGHWCDDCELHYYPSGTPNYKLHLESEQKL